MSDAERIRELELRLADAYAVITAVDFERDLMLLPGIISAVEHALTGSSGCVEPETWELERQAAHLAYGRRLELPA